jgi:hypothetical protein
MEMTALAGRLTARLLWKMALDMVPSLISYSGDPTATPTFIAPPSSLKV